MNERKTFGTIHVKDGWVFNRFNDGSVRICMTDPSRPSGNDNPPLAQIVISCNEWESVIAGMSAYESSAQAFDMAGAFHTASPNLHKTGVDQSPVDNEASKEAFLKHQAEHHARN